MECIVTNLGPLESYAGQLVGLSEDLQNGLRLVAVLLGLTSAFTSATVFAVVIGYFRRG